VNYFRRRFGTLKKISKFKRMDLLLKSWRGRGERGEGIDHYMLPPPPAPSAICQVAKTFASTNLYSMMEKGLPHNTTK